MTTTGPALSFALLLVAASAASSQTLVLGRVSDGSQNGIPGVGVVVVADRRAGERVVTDENGAFQVRLPPRGRDLVLLFSSRRMAVRGRSLRLNPDAGRQTASFPDMRVEVRFVTAQSAPAPVPVPVPLPEAPPPPPPPPEAAPPPTAAPPTYSIVRRETGRRLLPAGEMEEAGFGLYSYLLLKRRAVPGEAAYDLHLSTVASLISQVEPIEGLLPYRDQAELNITYVPVVAGGETDDDPARILDQYDYARARILASAIADAGGDGPYFVSVPAPLGRGRTAPARVLVQDLSGVPARLAALWVKKFVEQVSEPRAWDEVGFSQLVLLLRTRIAREADAFPEYRSALVSLIILR